jgi:hypothetical protein
MDQDNGLPRAVVFVVKFDVARIFFSDRNVWHFESPSYSDKSMVVPMALY